MSNEIKTITAIEDFKSNIVLMEPEFKLALPEHIPVARFMQIAQTAVMTTPSLLQCDRQSLYMAIKESAVQGLLPDGKEAVIIPFAGRAKFLPMVAGMCKKARNSGEISTIDAQVVFENDQYESWVDEKGPHFKHKRSLINRGNPIVTYAYAIGKDGGVFFEEIDEEQMEAIKKMSKAKDSPWVGPFVTEMRRKSALRRLCKYRLPNSSDIDLQSTLKQDDELYEDHEEQPKDVTPSTTPKVLAATIEATQAEVVATVKQVFPEATVIPPQKPKPAPVKSPPTAQGTTISGMEVTGVIAAISAKPAKNGNMRHSVRIGEKSWFGTFSESIGKQMAEAADGKYEVKIKYIQKKTPTDVVYNDIVSFEAVGLNNDGEIPL